MFRLSLLETGRAEMQPASRASSTAWTLAHALCRRSLRALLPTSRARSDLSSCSSSAHGCSLNDTLGWLLCCPYGKVGILMAWP